MDDQMEVVAALKTTSEILNLQFLYQFQVNLL